MKKIKYTKIKVLLLSLLLLVLIYIFLVILSKTYANYESSGEIDVNVDKALYVFEEGKLNFNIDIDKIVPSDEPYIYTFSISNYKNSIRSDVDIEYNLSFLATTNLPLTYELYYNNYNSPSAINLLENIEYRNDIDGSWYKVADMNTTYLLNYNVSKTDIFYLVVYFPLHHSNNIGYEGLLDNIEITINSKQKIG